VFIAIGLAVLFGSIIAGYSIHGGNVAVLVQISEFVIIGGAGLGAAIIGNKPRVVLRLFKETFGLLKPDPYGKTAYAELLQVLYDVFYVARKDGLIGIEPHIEEPEKSELFQKYPRFLGHHEAVSFLSDTMKVLLTGSAADHHLSEILDIDLEQRHEAAMVVPSSMSKIGDAMPAFGIVAAVLGVIITMGRIGGSPMEIGESIAAALVGTFLGVLLAYGVFGPLAQAIEARTKSEQAYMMCIRTALLSFARGDPPITCVEFARRNIDPADRPSFAELEGMTRNRGAAA
jgi:chemotaxis protein MotA